MQVDLRDKTVIVTGANSGIGKVTALELSRMGARVVLVVRSQERGAKALDEINAAGGHRDVKLMLCDFSSQLSIRQFAERFRAENDRLDVLVNNAGVFLLRRHESVDGLEMTFAVNHMGYFLLTDLLLEMLKASAPSRVINVSSAAHTVGRIDFDDLQRHRQYGMNVYGESKLMNILFTYALARRLTGTGVTVNAMHPGFVRTNLARYGNGPLLKFAKPLVNLVGRSPEKGAETIIYLAASPDVETVTGKYFVDKQAARSHAYADDEETQERLWKVSEAALVAAKPDPASS